MDALFFILIGLVGLSLIVTIHEAGHFVVARWMGVEVEAFALGWGKVLWAWKPGKTEYRICLLPLGGYCKMKGEQDLLAALQRQDGAFEPAPGSLFGASPLRRIAISVAGPVFNLVFALIVFFSLQAIGVPETAPAARILLASEVESQRSLPADQAGLQTGDVILAVGNSPIQSFSQLQKAVAQAEGRPLDLRLQRGGVVLEKTVTPEYDAKEKRSLIGVYPLIDPVVRAVKKNSIADLAGFRPGDRIVSVHGDAVNSTQGFFQALQRAPASLSVTVVRQEKTAELLLVPNSPQERSEPGLEFVLPTFPARPIPPGQALSDAWNQTWNLLGQMVSGLAQLVTGKVNPSEALSGPLRITYYMGEVVSQGFLSGWGQGWGASANFIAFLSLALFLMNLLPIPALDGGSVVVSLFELAFRRRMGIKALMRYQQVGVVVILGLVLFTTFNDTAFLFGPK